MSVFGSKIKKIDNKIEEVKTPLFVGTLFVWHLLYFLVFFGVVYINSTYIHYLSIFIQLFITGFLILRFHPFRKHEISRFDAIVIFASATFLLTNLLTTEILAPYLPGIENYLKKVVHGTFLYSNISSHIGIPSSSPSPTNAVTTMPQNMLLAVPTGAVPPLPTLFKNTNNTIGPVSNTIPQDISTTITYYRT